MLRRFAPLFILLSLVAVACTSEGLPNSYTDQDSRAQTQFIEACEAALADSDESEIPATCECAFYTVASSMTFQQFLDLDEQLKDDPGSLSREDRDLISGISLPCEFDASTVNNTAISS